MKHKHVFLLLLFLLVGELIGCNKVDKNEIVGAWYRPEDSVPSLIIYENGQIEKIEDHHIVNNWEITKDDQLIIMDSNGNISETFFIEAKDNHLKLTTDNDTYIYQKKSSLYSNALPEQVQSIDNSKEEDAYIETQMTEAEIESKQKFGYTSHGRKYELYDFMKLSIDETKSALKNKKIPHGYEIDNSAEMDTDDHYTFDIGSDTFNIVGELNSYNREYIQEIWIFGRNEEAKEYSILGVSIEMNGSEATQILNDQGFEVVSINIKNGEWGPSQRVKYSINEIYSLEIEIVDEDYDMGDLSEENDIVETGVVRTIHLRPLIK